MRFGISPLSYVQQHLCSPDRKGISVYGRTSDTVEPPYLSYNTKSFHPKSLSRFAKLLGLSVLL